MLIQDLETKGAQPFSNIVAELFDHQPELTDLDSEEQRRRPNRGKKVLAFSDSRQKAATLARDLQRDLELDSCRTAFFSTLARELSLEGEWSLDELSVLFTVYCAKINISFFDNQLRENFFCRSQ